MSQRVGDKIKLTAGWAKDFEAYIQAKGVYTYQWKMWIETEENANSWFRYKKWYYKDIEIDFEGYSAKKNGNNIDLKPKEIKLLELLLKYSGKVLTRTQILDNIWNIEESPNDRVIDVYIKNIRKKLGIDCIITVKGIGYKFEEKL